MVADSINLMRRTHMKSVLKALAIAALSTAPAIAQEWSGPYVGATASVATLRTAWTDVEYDWFGGTVDQRRSKLNGGLQWGYNNQKGNSVIGWELDYRPGHVYINTDMGNLPPVLEKTDALRHLVTLRGRAGLAVDNALAYLTAGLARGDIRHSLIANGNPSNGSSTPTFYNKNLGLAYGVGLEHRVSDRYSLRVEYLGAVWPTQTVSTNGGSRYDQKDRVSFLSLGLNLHY